MSLAYLKSSPGDEPIVVEGVFNAPPSQVFRAWTQPGQVKKWFGAGDDRLHSADIDLTVGGAWRFDFGMKTDGTDVVCGEYLAIEPDRQLVFSWQHEHTSVSGATTLSAASKVSVTFEEVDAGTLVRLVHERIVRDSARLSVGDGWNGSFGKLDALTAALTC